MIDLHYNDNKYFNLIANYTDTTATLSVCKKYSNKHITVLNWYLENEIIQTESVCGQQLH